MVDTLIRRETIIKANQFEKAKPGFVRWGRATRQGFNRRFANIIEVNAFVSGKNFVSFEHPSLKIDQAMKVGIVLKRLNFMDTTRKVIVTKQAKSYTIIFEPIPTDGPPTMTQTKIDPRSKTFNDLPLNIQKRKELANNIFTLLRIRDKGYAVIQPIFLPRQREFMANYANATTEQIDVVVETLRHQLHNRNHA